MRGHPDATTDLDPEAVADREGVDVVDRTHTHDDADHCEADALGRAIVGVTDDAGRTLLAVAPDRERVLLPNDLVAPGEDWATVARERVAGLAGIDPTVESVRRVRRVEHRLEGADDPESVTHHVVFGATADRTDLDGLCADNDWELGWYRTVPAVAATEGSESLSDVRLFVD